MIQRSSLVLSHLFSEAFAAAYQLTLFLRLGVPTSLLKAVGILPLNYNLMVVILPQGSVPKFTLHLQAFFHYCEPSNV